MSHIPIVSLVDPAAAGALCDALAGIGFAYLVDHGVPSALVDAAFAASRDFHASPLVLKQSLAINEFQRGYMGLETSTIVTSSVAKVTRPNLSESLMLMHELAPDDPDLLAGRPLQGPNQWPAWLPGFRPAISTYIAALDELSRRIIRLIATGLGLAEDALDRHFARPTTFLRLLHYPPHPPTAPDGQYGSAPHTDYGIIT